jgi:phosphatidate cytidylyltransferase
MLKRTVVGLIAGVLFLAFCVPPAGIMSKYAFWTALLVALVIHTLCTVEFSRMTRRINLVQVVVYVIWTTILLVLASLSLARYISASWIFIALGALMLYYATVAVLQYERSGETDIWDLLRSLLFVTLPLALLAPIATWPGRFPFLLLLAGASWGADTGAIWAGKAIGRRKFAPRISPNKTVEGLLGGLLSSGAVWAVAAVIYPLPESWSRLGLGLLPPWLVVAKMFFAGAIAALAGVLGDLTFSLFKRQAGLKDYGQVMPGHGGMLDRVDSFLFVAPVVYLLCLL